jgi:hypothetical protein
MTIAENDLEKRLAQLKQQVPKRGIERHPLVLRNVYELPAELQSPAVISLAASKAIQTIVAFPPQIHRGWHYVSKQALLFAPTDVIHVQASLWPDQEPQVAYLDASGFMYMRITLLLLYGFLEVVAQGHTSPTQLGVEFNTVAWYSYPGPYGNCCRRPEPRPAHRQMKPLVPRLCNRPSKTCRSNSPTV